MSRPPRDVGSFRGLEGLSDEVVQRLEQLRELVQRSAGTRGTSGALVTGSGGSTNITIVGGGSGGGSTTPDLTPPPTPTGVDVSAGLTYVFIEHDAPTFTQGHGYGRTRVYGATYEGSGPLPTFDPGSGTPLIHEFVGEVGAFPTNPATEWHLWVTWMSVDGVESVAPSGGTNGHVATTGQDVGVLLELLTGQITESQLYAALGAKIDALEPGRLDTLGESVLATVSALHKESKQRADHVAREALDRAEQVGVEAQARIDAVAAEAVARAQGLLNEAAARGADISTVRTEFQTADTSLAQQITDLTAAVDTLDTDTAAAIQLEATTRADADSAEALAREQLAARLDQADLEQVATIESVRRTLVDADQASAEQSMVMVSTTHRAGLVTQAAILEESNTRSTESSAEATKRETLSVKVLGVADPNDATADTLSSGLLFEEKSARVTSDDAQVSRIEGLEAKVDIGDGESVSSILTNYSTIASRDAAIAVKADEITTSYTAAIAVGLASANAYTQTYSYSKSEIDSAEAAQTSSITTAFQSGDTATYNSAKSYTESYSYSKSETDSAVALASSTLTTAYQAADDDTLNSAESYVQTYAYSKSAVDSAEAAQTSSLTTAFTSADATVYSNAQSWVQGYAYSKSQADSAIATAVSQVSARLNSGGDVYSSIAAAQSTASAKNATFKQSTTPTATKVGDTWIDTGNGNILKVWGGSAWVASDDARIGTAASNITTLQSQIAGSASSGLLSQLQTEATTRADETGFMSALYTVRVSLTQDGRSVVGGFGLSGVSSGTAGPTIDFGVRADKFWVGAPAGTTGVTDILPFVVQTSDQVVNGVTIPKGVYMDAAYIKNLTAMVARLGSAWIDNGMVANLSAAKLTAGSIAVGAYIQSSNYVANTSGWRIHGDGTAELQAVIVRGTVYATAGQIGGITIASDSIYSSNFSAGSAGWRLHSDGSAEFGAASIRGQISASQVSASSLSAITATIGTLRTASSGARMEIKDNVIKVFDSSGTLRVRLGDLTL